MKCKESIILVPLNRALLKHYPFMKLISRVTLLKQLWLVPTCFVVFLLLSVSKNQNLNDLLFKANYDGGLDGLSLEFNKDGTFNMYAGDLTRYDKLKGTFL